MKKKSKIIIEGITESGEQFRPSDWAERMSGTLSTFRKRHIHYSPLLQPSMRNGYKCVLIDPGLKRSNPELYCSIIQFAKNNRLRICGEEIDIEEEDRDADSESKTDTE